MKTSDILTFALGFALGNPETRRVLTQMGSEMGMIIEREVDKARQAWHEAHTPTEEKRDDSPHA